MTIGFRFMIEVAFVHTVKGNVLALKKKMTWMQFVMRIQYFSVSSSNFPLCYGMLWPKKEQQVVRAAGWKLKSDK